MTSFGATPDTQLGYQHGDDFSADRQRIEEGLMGRLNPSLAIERNKYEQQLADQGILYGSPAYENAMRNYSMQANDARFAAIAQGGQEQQRLSDMARQAGEFHNAAAQQQYEQAIRARPVLQRRAAAGLRAGRRSAARSPTPRRRRTSSRRSRRSTHPTPRGSSTSTRQFALRNQPINEISALLSGSQVCNAKLPANAAVRPSRPPTLPG